MQNQITGLLDLPLASRSIKINLKVHEACGMPKNNLFLTVKLYLLN
jgi:hypothetical protein